MAFAGMFMILNRVINERWEPTAGILDAYSSAVGAYGLRHLFGIYTGPHLKIRRSSDSAEADIWFDEFGTLQKLTTATETFYITDLNDWLNGATAYVTTWYDQSGQGNHGTPPSTAAQPSLDLTNRWVVFANGDYFNLPNGTVPSGNSRYTVLAYHGSINNTNGGILGSGIYGTNNRVNAFRRRAANNGYTNYWWGNDHRVGGYAANQTITYTYDQSARRGYVNGSLVGTRSGGGRNSGSGKNTIGVTNNSEYLTGQLNSVIIWNIALSGSDVSGTSQALRS